MTTKDTIYLIIGLQTLVISIIFYLYRSPKYKANRFLALFFFTLSVESVLYFISSESNSLEIKYLPIRFDFLTITFLFIYSKKTLGINSKSERKLYLPAIIEFSIFSVLFILVSINSEIDTILRRFNFMSIYLILSSSYIVLLSILIIRNNISHRKLLKFHYSDIKNKRLDWLTFFCGMCILLNVFRQLNFIVVPNEKIINSLFFVIGLGSLYFMTIASLVQINIYNIIPSQDEVKELQNELELVMSKIIVFLKNHRTYAKSDLNLKSFSQQIQIPERTISKAINQIEGLNFNSFINRYRINEYKELMKSEEYKNYNIYAIAEEVGFNSRASFYKNFKDMVGMSPTDFQKRQLNSGS